MGIDDRRSTGYFYFYARLAGERRSGNGGGERENCRYMRPSDAKCKGLAILLREKFYPAEGPVECRKYIWLCIAHELRGVNSDV